jgi:hypothetical protein
MTTTDSAYFPRHLRPLAEAVTAGAVALPKTCSQAMDVAAKLAVAEREGEHDAEESRTALRAAHDAAVRRLAEHGPTPEPSRDVRDAEAVTKARAATSTFSTRRPAGRRHE